MEEPLNIVITGVGGQGNVVASRILGSAAAEDGLYVSIGETYGAAQRGGAVMSHVRLFKQNEYGSLIPKGRTHIILGFEPVECLRTLASFGNKKTKVIVNPRPIYPVDVLADMAKYPALDDILGAMKELVPSTHVIEATELAKKAGSPVMQNIVMIGCLAGSGFTLVKIEAFKRAINTIFAEKHLKANLKAFELGEKAIMKAKRICSEDFPS